VPTSLHVKLGTHCSCSLPMLTGARSHYMHSRDQISQVVYYWALVAFMHHHTKRSSGDIMIAVINHRFSERPLTSTRPSRLTLSLCPIAAHYSEMPHTDKQSFLTMKLAKPVQTVTKFCAINGKTGCSLNSSFCCKVRVVLLNEAEFWVPVAIFNHILQRSKCDQVQVKLESPSAVNNRPTAAATTVDVVSAINRRPTIADCWSHTMSIVQLCVLLNGRVDMRQRRAASSASADTWLLKYRPNTARRRNGSKLKKSFN